MSTFLERMRAVESPQAWCEHLSRSGESLHVYLDGIDVTKQCFHAHFTEGEHGVVMLYKRNEDGRLYVDPEAGGPAQETRTGVLRVEPGEPFNDWQRLSVTA